MDWTKITVRIDWTRCTRRRWPPTRELHFAPQERRKRRHVLLYWWAGRGERRIPEGVVSIHAGLCHWARLGWSYACTQDPRNPLGVTAIHFDLIDARGEVIPPDAEHVPPERLTVRSPRLVDEITRWIAERAMESRAGMSLPREIEEAANSMLRGLLVKLDHDTPSDPGALPGADTGDWRQLAAYIQEHLHELGGVETLAAKAGYTRSHFSRLFKEQTGLSPREYVIAARINLAKELLRSTTLTVSEIAARVGCSDIYTFSKQFKLRADVSPSMYRVRSGG
jgi:AraC family transcriptional regulator of arabinose operon